MQYRFLKFGFILSLSVFMLVFSACEKPADTIAIIKVIDVNGNPVEGARVRLHQDGLVSTSGQYSNISDEQWSDASGTTEHVFEHEAILNVEVSKWVGTNELVGTNVIRLLKEKTVSKTVEID